MSRTLGLALKRYDFHSNSKCWVFRRSLGGLLPTSSDVTDVGGFGGSSVASALFGCLQKESFSVTELR